MDIDDSIGVGLNNKNGGRYSTAGERADAKLQRKLISVHDLEKYCRPQQLALYNPVDSGFKYNVIGLFNMPDAIDP